MTATEAKVRPKASFLYSPGELTQVVPDENYAGCYVLKHEFRADARPPAPANLYTVVLYVDVAAGPTSFKLHDDGGGLVVDVPEGFVMDHLEGVIKRFFGHNPTGPDGPVGGIGRRP